MSTVIVAEFEVVAGRSDDFAEYLRWHGAESLKEPGCQMFQANRDLSDPHRFVMYEIYDNETAIDAHRQTPHYQRFVAEIIPDMLVMQGDVPFVSRSLLEVVFP